MQTVYALASNGFTSSGNGYVKQMHSLILDWQRRLLMKVFALSFESVCVHVLLSKIQRVSGHSWPFASMTLWHSRPTKRRQMQHNKSWTKWKLNIKCRHVNWSPNVAPKILYLAHIAASSNNKKKNTFILLIADTVHGNDKWKATRQATIIDNIWKPNLASIFIF
jgi:hypothetical protein